MAPTRAASVADHPSNDVDIAIITVLQEEYEAVRQRLKNPRRDPGTAEQPNQYAWVLGEVERAEGGSYQVVLAIAGSPGTTSGSLATSRTIAVWRPRYVLLVGIAGGMVREDLALGDVVVSSIIRAYEYGFNSRVAENALSVCHDCVGPNGEEFGPRDRNSDRTGIDAHRA